MHVRARHALEESVRFHSFSMWILTKNFVDLHDCYLASVGRSLLLAQSFEQNCKFVCLIWDLGDAFESKTISDVEQLPDYSALLLKRFLGTVIQRFGSRYPIKREQYEILERAREARNYIAHEAGTPCLYYNTHEPIIEALPQLRTNITALAEGDNLVSGWSYMIQEKNFPPAGIRQSYVHEITSYILEPLEDYV